MHKESWQDDVESGDHLERAVHTLEGEVKEERLHTVLLLPDHYMEAKINFALNQNMFSLA